MKLISNLRNSSILKRILFYLTGVLLFAYVFSVPSFGEATNITRYIVYVSMSLLGIVVIIYLALFDSFRLRKVFLLIPLFSIFALFGTILFSHEFRSWLSLILLAISFFVFTYAFKIIKSKYIVVAIISSAFFAFSLFFIACYWRQILDFRSYTNDSFRLGWRFDNPNGVSAYAVVGGVPAKLIRTLNGWMFDV